MVQNIAILVSMLIMNAQGQELKEEFKEKSSYQIQTQKNTNDKKPEDANFDYKRIYALKEEELKPNLKTPLIIPPQNKYFSKTKINYYQNIKKNQYVRMQMK